MVTRSVSLDSPSTTSRAHQRALRGTAAVGAHRLGLSSAFVLLVALSLLPSLVWIFRDRSVWTWDQATYATLSIRLFRGLTSSPYEWLRALFSIDYRAPGTAWLGQLFVPIGVVLGSIDAGLLLSIATTQATTAALLFVALRKLAPERPTAVLAGCGSLLSAPLFIALSHQYLVEPLQMLSVAWFLLMLTHAREWSVSLVLVQLVAAASVALLAKIATPLYVLAPGMVTVIVLAWRLRRAHAVARPSSRAILLWFPVLLLALITLCWYARSWAHLSQFAVDTTVGTIAQVYGTPQPLPVRFEYWLSQVPGNLIAPGPMVAIGGVLLVGWLAGLRRRQLAWKTTYFEVCLVVALLELVGTLLVFSAQILTDPRFLLPLLPYVALIVTWAVARLDVPRLSELVLAILILQSAGAHAQALGLQAADTAITWWLQPVVTDPTTAEDVAAVVERTCGPDQNGRSNPVGVDIRWFNASSLNYAAAKARPTTSPGCRYAALGFAEPDAGIAWRRVLDADGDYFVTVDPTSLPAPVDQFNAVAKPILDRIQASDAFVPVSLEGHPRMLVFQRIGSRPPTTKQSSQ